MQTISPEVLSLSGEASILIRAGRVSYVNPAAQTLLGECLGKSVRELFGEEIAAAQAPVFATDAMLHGKLCTVRRSHFGEVQAYFIAAVQPAQDLMSEAFLYTMRTSLMNLRLSIELSRKQAESLGDENLSRSLTQLCKNYFTLTRLLDNAAVVHAMERDGTGVVIHTGKLDLTALCRSIINTLSILRKDVSFTLDAGEYTEMVGDKVLIEQMILNLISNCLLHAEGLSHILLCLSERRGRVIITVSDDGCGIPSGELCRVFERYRYAFTLDNIKRGSGLGLSVVRAVARAHGGTLLLESREGYGTIARVSMDKNSGELGLCCCENTLSEGMRPILTGLAESLDLRCFENRYED